MISFSNPRSSRSARNPRFAPEFLERKLSPSSYYVTPTAYVSSQGSSTPPSNIDPPEYPKPTPPPSEGDGTPPINPCPSPGGPTTPA